jgi:cytochrome c biogenesis protein CcdA/thiol-disulfide isomerase/thioredoxin
MALLMLFAAIAGAGTALSPCVLPILPAVLAAGVSGGRRRPLGVVLGLAATFALTIAGLSELVGSVGVGNDALRSLAVLVLLGFGVLMIVPAATERVSAALSGLARFGPRSRGDGFVTGLGVGAALGFVYAPCAGPILAAVITVSAATGESVALAISYAAGSAAALLLIALGGRKLLRPLRGPRLQRAMGAVMIATAVAVLAGADLRFQAEVADDLPAVLVNPTGALERSAAVERRLTNLRGAPRFASERSGLPSLGAAPEFVGVTRWFNSPALTMRGLRGKVVLIDFWTYTCINCLRTLPYLRAWDARYGDRGLVIVGVHTPEFGFEEDPGNVRDAIARSRLRYAVAQDNGRKTWDAWGNLYWPAKYLIDATGQVRFTHFGEGAYKVTEHAIRSLLAEAGAGRLGDLVDRPPERLRARTTPETYVGAARAERWLQRPRLGVHDYIRVTGELYRDQFALTGRWRVDPEAAAAVRAAEVRARITGRAVYLVLSSRGGRARRLQVDLDSRPYRRVTVRRQRLYRLVSLPRRGEHILTLRFQPGISAYAFTFG